MKRTITVVVVFALAILAGYFGYRAGWLGRARNHAAGPAQLPAEHPSSSLPQSETPGPGPRQAATPAGGKAAPATLPKTVNLVAPDVGGRIESFTSQYDHDRWSARRLIDGDPTRGWSSGRKELPEEIVFSFLAQEPVVISAVVINPEVPRYPKQDAKDVEIWISTNSPTEGFSRAASATLKPEPVDQTITFAPAEARYVKLRVLSNHGGNDQYVSIAEVQVIEGRRAGYVPLLERNPELTSLLVEASTGTAASATTSKIAVPGTSLADCMSVAPAARMPTGQESKNVLVVSRDEKDYPPLQYKPDDKRGNLDYSIYGRLTFTHAKPDVAAVALLAQGIDTVVLAQVCDIKTSVSDTFKRALVAWVARGHKLIIQDSDNCRSSPDYSFLPYKFATSNPGARGASGGQLIFVEENTIGNAKPEDPAFLDIESWLKSEKGSHNEIGDSNTVTQYDPEWCGHLFGTNVLHKNGFMEAYAHLGKGLIIYDGFDVDQGDGVAYRQLVTRELAQPFNPDNLTCSARLGDFVITTEQRLKNQPMAPGRTYVYPLTLLSNQGYKGTLKLSLMATPTDSTLTYKFEPDTVELTEISSATLTVTTNRDSLPALHMLSVRGTDVTDKSSALCLQLSERKTGAIQVISTLQSTKKPTKNLEIILDVSGSMKLPLGKSTRWQTALAVFKEVVEKLPDDFNVGLRVYAHRYSARSNDTCTDSELLLPVAKLDRGRILSTIQKLRPRGETPLVYSVLQTIDDLKKVGGGSVVLITDGEETCKGNLKTAAEKLKAAGIDITLNIVGFTLKGKEVQQQLTQFAESTGGRYYSAQSGEALARALLIAAVEKFPFEVFDAAGKLVAKGNAGAPPEELPVGEYRVKVRAADQELVATVSVATAADTVLKVVLQDNRFALQR